MNRLDFFNVNSDVTENIKELLNEIRNTIEAQTIFNRTHTEQKQKIDKELNEKLDYCIRAITELID